MEMKRQERDNRVKETFSKRRCADRQLEPMASPALPGTPSKRLQRLLLKCLGGPSDVSVDI